MSQVDAITTVDFSTDAGARMAAHLATDRGDVTINDGSRAQLDLGSEGGDGPTDPTVDLRGTTEGRDITEHFAVDLRAAGNGDDVLGDLSVSGP